MPTLAIILIVFALVYHFAKYAIQKEFDETPLNYKKSPAQYHTEQTLVTLDEAWVRIMEQQIIFFQRLTPKSKKRFIDKMVLFLNEVTIVPMEFTPQNRDYIYLAASAVMPIFHTDHWNYPNLSSIILHDKPYLEMSQDAQGEKWYTTGMMIVMRGADVIHISRPALWQDMESNSPTNVALHEFVHFIDLGKNNSLDGIPDILFDKKYIKPWIDLMILEMQKIHNKDSKIRSYAASNEAEFLATTSEYYFKTPDILQKEHPELFEMMDKVYKNQFSV